MPFPDFSRIFSSPQTPDIHGDQGNRESPPQGSEQRRDSRHPRAQTAFHNFAMGGAERMMEMLSAHLGSGPTRFMDAIASEMHEQESGPPLHGANRSGHTDAHRFPFTSSSPSMGGNLHHIFERLMGDVPARLEDFFANRPAQITTELETFKKKLQEQKRTGGAPPPSPRGVPRAMTDLMREMDPDDPEFDQTVLEMAQAYTSMEQRGREASHNAIGTAPRPRPGHAHGERGDATEPQLAPDGTPLFPESDGFDPATVYHNDPNQGSAP